MLPLPSLRISPSLPALWHAANSNVDHDNCDELPPVVDSDYNINASQPSTPDRLIFPRAFGVSSPQADNRGTTPTPPLTPSSASTNATSNTWRSPTSPLAVANVKLAVDEEEQHGSRLGLGLGFGKGVLDEDRGLSSLSLNDADASSQLKSDRFLSNDDSEGRYLLVQGVPQTAAYEQVHEIFTNACARASPVSKDHSKPADTSAPLRGIWVRLLATHGIVILAFYDPRQISSAERSIRSMQSPGTGDCDWKIDVTRIGEAKLREMLLAYSPNSSFNFIAETEGVLLVCVESTTSTRRAALDDVPSIRLLLAGFGEVRGFETLPHAWYADHEDIAQAYRVEYFDTRRGAQAREKLDGRSLFGTRLRVRAFSAAAGTTTQFGSGLGLRPQSNVNGNRSATTSGAGESSLDGQGQFARYAFPSLSASTTTTTRSQPASPLGMLSALSPLSTHSLGAADSNQFSLPPSPLSASSPSFAYSSREREMLVALNRGGPLPSTIQSQPSSPPMSSIRRISTGSLVLASSSSGSSNSSSGTVTANVSPAASGRALSPIRGSGSGLGTGGDSVTGAEANAVHPSSSEQDLRRRAAVSAALQAQAQAGESFAGDKTLVTPSSFLDRAPSSPGKRDVGRLRTTSTEGHTTAENKDLQHSPMKRMFPLEEDDSPLEQTTYPSIWQSPLSPAPKTSPDDEMVYWDGVPYPPPFSSPHNLVVGGGAPPPTSPPMYASSGMGVASLPPFGIPPDVGMGMHPFMQVPMTPVQQRHAYAHSSVFGMISPPQEDHAQASSLAWGADGGRVGNHNSLSLSPPSSVLSASSSSFTPPRFNRMHASGPELLMSPLSPVNMYRGPTPFNTPAVPFPPGPYAGGGGARARQHPPPHAHPPRAGLYTSMHSPSSPSRSSPTSANASGSNEKNQIDLERIAAGLDTRTTVMIKNIPNKLSDKDLVEYIGKVCPRKIDFLYLRMDFQNGCNVGYAFVNFIRVEDLLLFASSKLGIKWNMFSSEKVLQMSYANYQGKEALVEKFKNSCVMDEREAWRPKIFFSSGPRQGLPEPFPSPTHLRRKERSSQNRGALFVPSPPLYGGGGGMGSSAHSPRHEMHNNPHPTTLSLGNRLRGWVLPSHGSPSSNGMGMMRGHDSLAPAPSLS